MYFNLFKHNNWNQKKLYLLCPVTGQHQFRCQVWQYGLWSFQTGYTKLERFLHKNQYTQRKLLNFENWTNGKPH